jgi:RimJ/RimL family protein N-acetyltransferase
MFGDQRPLTIEGHLQWFRSERKGRLDYVLERAADGVGIGLINFRNLDFELGEGESGRLIGEPAFRGQGYAREAALVWFRFGFLNLGLERIVGVTRVENEANLALNRSLGYMEVAGAAAGFVKMVLTREAAEAAFGLVEVQVCD